MLPSLREHREEVLLKELYTRWENHKLMVRWLSRFFNYLDRSVGDRRQVSLRRGWGSKGEVGKRLAAMPLWEGRRSCRACGVGGEAGHGLGTGEGQGK